MYHTNLTNRLAMIAAVALLHCNSSRFASKAGKNDPQPIIASPSVTPFPVASPWITPQPSPLVDLPTTDATQPVNEGIIGGSDQVFHVGDGQMSTMAECYTEVSTFGLSGKTFVFNFDVTEDNTQVQISIGKICGIEYAQNTAQFVRVSGTTQVLGQTNIAVGAPTLELGSHQLMAGRYQIIVASQVDMMGPDAESGDFDDFIVGDIKIRANKATIRIGDVVAQ